MRLILSSLLCVAVSRPVFAAPCAADLARLYRPSADAAEDFVGLLGISDAELRTLVRTGEFESAASKLWPRLVRGRPKLETERAKARINASDLDNAPNQLRRATLDAWARSVGEVLDARHGVTDFTTDRYLSFIRHLATDFDDFDPYSPTLAKIRYALGRSDIPKTGKTELAQVRTLMRVLNLDWLKSDSISIELWRKFELKFANLPSAGGAVVDLGSAALNQISWSARTAPFMRRLRLRDLGRISPVAPDGLDLLDRLTASER